MTHVVKILLIEDLPTDAFLAEHEIRKLLQNCEFRTVEGKEEFIRELSTWEPDLVISDYQLPSFDGLTALRTVLEMAPLTPVIIHTGSQNEDTAIDCMKAGAADYVIKEHIKRLGPAVLNALEQKEVRFRADSAQRKLVESEEKFRNIFQNHAAVELLLDPEYGIIVDANLAASDFYGWPLNELTSKPMHAVSAYSEDAVQRELKAACTNNPLRFESAHLSADGRAMIVDVFSSTITIGGKLFLHLIIHDISEKKLAEERLELLSRSVEQSQAGVAISNPEGRIEYVNPAFVKLTGYGHDHVLGSDLRLLYSESDNSVEFDLIWSTVKSGGTWEGELGSRRHTGDFYWVRAHISPIVSEHKGITQIVFVCEDVTEKKAMILDLVAAKEKAEESDRLKTAFINNISHEIRTPLNGILGFGQLLADEDHTVEERREFYTSVQESSNRLLRTVGDYMDIAMIVSGTMKITKESHAVNGRLEEMCEAARKRTPYCTIPIELTHPEATDDLHLYTDWGMLTKIISHLLDNAQKFTREGQITLGYSLQDGEMVFTVRDTGKGITRKKLGVIFDAYMQEDNSLTRGYEGSGLGLTIARGMIELLGGRIEVESEEGRGSEFRFTVPHRNESVQRGANVQAQRSNAPEPYPLILIAEDDSANSVFLDIVLKRAGYRTLRASDGLEAVEYCRNREDISLVLMDIKMPGLNGVESTVRIKEFRANLPVIAVTAYAQTGDESRFLEIGCDAYISKPIDRSALLELINSLVRRRANGGSADSGLTAVVPGSDPKHISLNDE